MKLRNRKTGEIQNPNSIVITDDSEKDGVFVFRSIEQLVEEYEDYKPAEPLINNKNIRKAVRAWAALYDEVAIRAHIGEDYVALFKDEVNCYSSSVEIDLSPEVFNELIDAHYYTIAELCGEEEE